mmetsp:Transcript_39184/g.50663  ORF Transcript_39184/g.50663 Transcript_39184/m.50663 type:complete len:133 (+) Transcript_39184:161-559(+)
MASSKDTRAIVMVSDCSMLLASRTSISGPSLDYGWSCGLVGDELCMQIYVLNLESNKLKLSLPVTAIRMLRGDSEECLLALKLSEQVEQVGSDTIILPVKQFCAWPNARDSVVAPHSPTHEKAMISFIIYIM